MNLIFFQIELSTKTGPKTASTPLFTQCMSKQFCDHILSATSSVVGKSCNSQGICHYDSMQVWNDPLPIAKSIHIAIFTRRSDTHHMNYMSIRNKKYDFIFNGFIQNSTISLNLFCFLTKMMQNEYHKVIHRIPNKLRNALWLASRLFTMSAIMIISFCFLTKMM